MARPLDRQRTTPELVTHDRQVARSTARAFAAAAAALLVSTLVVARSDAALLNDGTGNATTFEAGTIALSDDDNGRSLFDLSNMSPGNPSEQCITVGYEGSILPVDVNMNVTAQGPLTNFLITRVERGTGGSFDDCSGFEADEIVFEGSLSQLANAELTGARVLNDGTQLTFRFVFDLADEAGAIGAAASSSIVWEALPA